MRNNHDVAIKSEIKIWRSTFGARRPEKESFTLRRAHVRWLNGSDIKFVDGDVIKRSSKLMRNNHDVVNSPLRLNTPFRNLIKFLTRWSGELLANSIYIYICCIGWKIIHRRWHICFRILPSTNRFCAAIENVRSPSKKHVKKGILAVFCTLWNK